MIVLSAVGITYALYRAGIKFPQNLETKTIYFAPYVNSTHSCFTHASSCTAELINTEISFIINTSDGSININDSAITGANGFFELNLPANNSFTVKFSVIIHSDIYTGSTTFDTYPDTANCITTGQLTI
ncbi:MAG: CueP family metal-binding protein [Candidatus Hodarchaeales archaeon]